MKVKCSLCSHYEDGHCTAKSSGGKHPGVKKNSYRKCDKYSINPIECAKEADKEYYRREIPVYAPTWRYWSTNKELDEQGERKGNKYVRINPDVNKQR